MHNLRNIEFKVEVTNFCKYGRCRFCSPLFRPAVSEANSKIFLTSFKKWLHAYLLGGGRKIILTGGGEPLDAPAKLFGALRAIKEMTSQLGITLELLTIYTNGVSVLKPINPHAEERLEDTKGPKTALDVFVEHGVTDINFSLSGVTREQRDEITGPYMGGLDIDALITKITQAGIRVMTRTTLTDVGVASKEDIEKFTQRMVDLGVHIVYYSDMFGVPKRDACTVPGNKNVLDWTDQHRIAFKSLIAEVKQSTHFRFIEETPRHESQGITYEFTHNSSKTKVLFGSLDIGNEPEGSIVYFYMKADGSCGGTNNADEVRNYMTFEELLKCRPGRSKEL